MTAMKIVWDEAKRHTNLRKHGLDFADAEEVFAGITCTTEDERFDYGEQRFVTQEPVSTISTCATGQCGMQF